MSSIPNAAEAIDQEIIYQIYDTIKDIKDPEKPETLEDLNVVFEEGITIEKIDDESYGINIEFVPTVPHCSLATLIGLCIRVKLYQCLPFKHKLRINIKEGTHETAAEINKQINDKERVAAAMENPNLKELVDNCISEPEY
ncbi:unnamed protein product [Owenia fusiformis]|uniref:MIP18 family-like domain-containing protein n=1 Tax=Owenia fusiformis TaxID=6347 RepID=A0A8J1TY58_OWEFU|nr:unnamed protein product [Owenia fusiformis]